MTLCSTLNFQWYSVSAEESDGTDDILLSYDFETETQDWEPFDNTILSFDTARSHSGLTSLKSSEREHPYSGPAVNLTDYVLFGHNYYISIWTYYDGKIIDDLAVTLKYTFKDKTEDFENICIINSAEPHKWHNMNGSFSIPEKVEEITLYIESLKHENTIWIDDVVLSLTSDYNDIQDSRNAVILDPDGTTVFGFEESKDNWNVCRNANILRSDTTASIGKYSLYVYDRNDCRDGASYDISKLHWERDYRCSMAVAFFDKSTDTETFRLQLEYYLNNVLYNIPIEEKIIQRGSWSVIGNNSKIKIPEGAEKVYITLETAAPSDEDEYTHVSFYIDNVVISELSEENHKKSVNTAIIIVLSAFAAAAAVLICVILITKKQKHNADLLISLTDSMTGALNRNAYEQALEDFEKHPEKCKTHFFAVCDLNGLKQINDTLGHKAGDECIIKCAQILLSVFETENGNVYRTGGDEFVCIAHHDFKDKLISTIKKAGKEKTKHPLSIAFGFTSYDSEKDGSTPDIHSIINRCDKEMYQNKASVKKTKNSHN